MRPRSPGRRVVSPLGRSDLARDGLEVPQRTAVRHALSAGSAPVIAAFGPHPIVQMDKSARRRDDPMAELVSSFSPRSPISPAVRGGELWRPVRPRWMTGRRPADDLRPVARRLLHLLDLLRLGRPRLALGLRLPDHLYRPADHDRPRATARAAHRAARQGPEHHLDRRFRRRPLRQERAASRRSSCVAAVIGAMPYIALQLKAVAVLASTVLRPTGRPATRRATVPVLGDLAFFVAHGARRLRHRCSAPAMSTRPSTRTG